MDTAGTGLVLIVNGLLTLLGELASWPAVLALALVASMGYLATVEIAELDRSTFKPEVERH